MNATGDWLQSFCVLRESDTLICYVWLDGGSPCVELDARAIQVTKLRGGSHRSVLDYQKAALEHLRLSHPKEFEEQKAVPK